LETLDFIVLGFYFVGITVFGAMFGRFTKTTKDFFMAGQRFPAWLIAFSCVATLVGSYSFVKYSAAGFSYGIASSQTYLNDWFWMPLWMFGWFPILYFGGIVTVPEYFTKRFNAKVRVAATLVLLMYLIGYIGINLFTLGTALTGLAGLDDQWIILFAIAIAGMCMAYEFTGGQTSVIFTDLLQGVLLLIAGLGLFLVGVYHVGGFERFWDLLPEGHGRALPPFNDNPKFNFVGVFWQDGLAGGLAFYFMNQGMLLRFLSARSAGTARKAAGWVILVLMPLTAIAVAGAGWVARAMLTSGELGADVEAKHAFVEVAEILCAPGMFGIVIAALLAALMSTADTLINASSSILVNDFYKPFLVKNRDDKHYLKAAHWLSLLAAALGVALVPIYMQQESIYAAHGMFTAAITPPMAVAILFAFLWPRYNSYGAMASLAGGIIMMFVSIWVPDLIEPFSHGIDDSGGFKYIRACYGVAVSATFGIVATLCTAPPDPEKIIGLTLWTCRQQASSTPSKRPGKVRTTILRTETEAPVESDSESDLAELDLPELALSAAARTTLSVETGDVVFVDDARWWLGGLRSARCTVASETVDRGEITLPLVDLKRNRWESGHRVVISRVD